MTTSVNTIPCWKQALRGEHLDVAAQWRYGQGRPRLVSFAEAERIRAERLSESRIRAAETKKRRSEAAATAGGGAKAAADQIELCGALSCTSRALGQPLLASLIFLVYISR